jgi:hypothetical protein
MRHDAGQRVGRRRGGRRRVVEFVEEDLMAATGQGAATM